MSDQWSLRNIFVPPWSGKKLAVLIVGAFVLVTTLAVIADYVKPYQTAARSMGMTVGHCVEIARYFALPDMANESCTRLVPHKRFWD